MAEAAGFQGDDGDVPFGGPVAPAAVFTRVRGHVSF
jgi:hypothetical protein